MLQVFWKRTNVCSEVTGTVFAATHFFPGKLSLASRHPRQQQRDRHLFGFPAEIQCGIFSFQRGALWLSSRDCEVTTNTDRRWRPHETEHRSDCTRKKALGRPPGKKDVRTLATTVAHYTAHTDVFMC